MSAEQDNVPGFPPQVNIFLNLYVSLPAPSSNHSHASRYPYHLGFLPFNPGNNRKLFTRAIAPTGSKYQTSPASSPCSTTRAASTSISRAVYPRCTQPPPPSSRPVAFTRPRSTPPPRPAHTTKLNFSLSPQGTANLNPKLCAFSKNAACDISPIRFGFLFIPSLDRK